MKPFVRANKLKEEIKRGVQQIKTLLKEPEEYITDSTRIEIQKIITDVSSINKNIFIINS